MEEMKAASIRPQFGSVELIKSPDFVREVTNASQDAWVLVFLFKDGYARKASGCPAYPRVFLLRLVSCDSPPVTCDVWVLVFLLKHG